MLINRKRIKVTLADTMALLNDDTVDGGLTEDEMTIYDERRGDWRNLGAEKTFV